MEDIIRFVVTGCKLAQDLESNLGRLTGTGQLLEKCEQIAGAFAAASHRLRAIQCHVELHEQEQRVSHVAPAPVDSGGPDIHGSSKGKEQIPHLVDEVPTYEVRGGAGCSGGGEGSSVQKSRKRKDEAGKQTIEVAAPLHGNTEIPPDDGYTWRKYGQKEILGAQYPRGYFRCTHQRLYNCPAKKQVQRLNNNPRIFQVTYRGRHTCQMSSTAPASAIPPPLTSLPAWLAIELTAMTQPLGTSTSSVNVAMDHGRDHQGDHGAATDVVDLAAAMFNSSAGSGGDGIDSIFSK